MAKFKNLKDKTILLVEDEKVIRENIASTLKFFFKEVYVAIDGLDGMDKYEAYLPDIIMTDLKMPNMDGLELITTLFERGSSAYMIIVSAHTDTEFLLSALHQGVNRYIVKPIDENKLFETFDDYLRKTEKNTLIEIESHNGLKVNLDRCQIIKGKEILALSRKESLLLKLLLQDRHKTFTYEAIEYHVWGSKSMSVSALRTVVRDIRKKLGSNYLHNVSRVGYRFI